MPPKKRAVSRTIVTETLPANTQTQDLNKEIKSYLAKIDFLEKENAHYKNLVAKLESQLHEYQNDKLFNEIDDHSSLVKLDIRKNGVKGNKISSPIMVGKVSKGCSCKGNCSNKICGCVKRSVSCKEFCRCNDNQCKNQDKENMQQQKLCEDEQKALEKLNNLTLNQEFLHASGKKAKRGLYSPFGDRNATIISQVVASPLSLETRRRLFRQDSDDIVDVNINSDEDNAIQSNQSSVIGCQELKMTHTPVANRTRRVNLSENNYSDNTKKQTLPMILQSELAYDMKVNSELIKHDVTIELPDIIITNNVELQNTFPISSKRVVHSPQTLEVKSIISDNFLDQENIKKNAPELYSLDGNITYRNSKNQDKSNQSQNQNSPQQILNMVSDTENIRDTRESEVSQSSFESNISDTTYSNEILDTSLNPMVPKRQLPRSPINASGTLILPTDKKRFSPPKKELAVAEVDWEQHQSELIMCKKCKRKFFPHRVEKHSESCKGI